MRHLLPLILLCILAIPSWAKLPPGSPRITQQYLDAMKRDSIDKALGFTEAKYKIRVQQGWLLGDGQDLGTLRNNEAVFFILQDNFERARDILEQAKKRSPQFFAIRFNLGKVYLYYKDHHKALLEFKRAKNIVPQYWRNFYFLGRAYELQGDHNSAIFHYRTAYLKNPYDLESLVALGDILITRKRLSEALTVYRYCLRQDDGYNNALLGMGKLAFHYRDYYDATIWFRSMDLTKPYKKELHYYYAESAFFAQMYPMAVTQYKQMLRFPADAIYNRISLTRMRARLKQAQRLALQKESEN